MKKLCIILSLLVIIFTGLVIGNRSYALDLDRIENYVVTVEPRMNDGTLDITYEITWRVLDSVTEGPLEWVSIGTPNSNFDSVRALSQNIKSITKYNSSFVKIVFDKAYYAGQTITFKYSIHQSYMYKISGSNCKYEFTPAWFTDAKVDSLTVRWNSDKVTKSNNKSKDGSYLVWTKKDMAKGEKLNTSIQYKKSSFGALNENKQVHQNTSSSFYNILPIVVFIVMVIISIIFNRFGGGGYYGHRGFYGGGYYGGYHGGCVHSSCACASSCASSCACACAGSGRAGCSKKDFYGTNLNTKKLQKVLKS